MGFPSSIHTRIAPNAVRISGVGETYLTVDGEGEQGLCFGDSGGPLIAPGPDGRATISVVNTPCPSGGYCCTLMK